MASAPSENYRAPKGKTFVAYKDPSGGLNTKRDAHALDRNMAASSINFWPALENVIGKRPGNNFAITSNGVTGMGFTSTTTAVNVVATRWTIGGVSTTVLLAQNGIHLAFAAVNASSWTTISTTMGASPFRIHVAQMYDPLSGANQCFICNGVDLPWMWAGPGHTSLTQTSTANGLPVNGGGSTGITPRFVTTFLDSLVYAGEPTAPTGVYMSNPCYPQAFTQSNSTAANYPGSYQPQFVGYNDGVNGGNITGLANLQGLLLVFKESAVYRGQFVNTYGTAYAISYQCVSASRGLIAPESSVAFETFVCGLSIDGVYYTDGYQVIQFSGDVPTFFNGALNGYGPLCLQYPSAVACRMGSVYMIFYDRGLPTAPGTAAGYPTSGLWFDFAKPTQSGLPECGELQAAMSAAGTSWAVGGMTTLAGPYDTGLVVWTDPTQDRVSIFGLGFSDLGNPITVTFAGKADMIPEAANPSEEADGISQKTVHRAFLNVAVALGSPLTFTASIVTDLLSSTNAVGYSPPTAPGTGIWGSGIWGTSLWGSSASATAYAAIGFCPNQTADGTIIQFQVTESSSEFWALLGYRLEVSARMPNL